MKILITGGTGHLGREVTRLASEQGHVLRIVSRRPRPSTAGPIGNAVEWVQADLASGQGLESSLHGVDAVLHLASDPRQAARVDVAGTRHLVEAARQAGVSHFVYISIVGINRIPFNYYRCKLEAENILESSGVPFSILRATQFHSLLETMLSAVRLPLFLPLPTNFKFQGVAEFEVGGRLMQCLSDGPRGRLPDFGGPEVLTLGEIARTWMAFNHDRRKLIHLPLPGALAAAFRGGRNTLTQGERGTLDWLQWLEAKGAGEVETTLARSVLHQ